MHVSEANRIVYLKKKARNQSAIFPGDAEGGLCGVAQDKKGALQHMPTLSGRLLRRAHRNYGLYFTAKRIPSASTRALAETISQV